MFLYIYIQKHLNCNILDTLSYSIPDYVYIVSISMLINNKHTIIRGICKSHNSDIKRFSYFIYNNFSVFSITCDLFLVGDVNVNILIN